MHPTSMATSTGRYNYTITGEQQIDPLSPNMLDSNFAPKTGGRTNSNKTGARMDTKSQEGGRSGHYGLCNALLAKHNVGSNKSM